MATGFSVWGTNQKQKAWARNVIYEAMKESKITKFTGDGPNNVIQKKHEITKDSGDRVYFDLFIEFSEAPKTGHDPRSGNEEQLTSYTDDVLIGSTWHGFVKYGRLDDIYSQKNMVSIGKKMNKQYFANLINEYCIKWLICDTSIAWPEAVGTIASTRIFYGGNATGSDFSPSSDIATGDYLGTAEVSRLKYRATQCDPKFRKLNIEGGQYYVMFIHPRQAYTLKTDSSYVQAQREAMPRGGNNPLFTGALGMWDGVLLYEDEHCLTNTDNDEARGALCGQQAAMMAVGKPPLATEEHTNHGDRHALGIEFIWGLKRSVFNNVELSTCLMDTYATAPAGVAHS